MKCKHYSFWWGINDFQTASLALCYWNTDSSTITLVLD